MTPEPSAPEIGSLHALLQVGESTGTQPVTCLSPPPPFICSFPECHPSAVVGSGASLTVSEVTRPLNLGMMGLGIRSGGLPEAPGMPKPEPPLEKPFIPLPMGLLREKAGPHGGT